MCIPRLRASVVVPHSTVDECSRSEEHTSELQSRQYLVCRLLLEKKNKTRLSTPATRHKTCPQPPEAHRRRTPRRLNGTTHACTSDTLICTTTSSSYYTLRYALHT